MDAALSLVIGLTALATAIATVVTAFRHLRRDVEKVHVLVNSQKDTLETKLADALEEIKGLKSLLAAKREREY